MRDEDEQPVETGNPEAAQFQTRRAMLRMGALGTAAVITVKPGIANAAVSAISCSIPVPQSSQAGKWIKKDGTVVNPNTPQSYDPPDTPLNGEDVKNSLAFGTRYSGYNQNQTNAFNNYIKKLTIGKQGYTCYSSIQSHV